MWHKVAPQLARDHTVVCADLRGYGDSAKPPGDPEHATYAKRAMARDQLEAMRALGFERFAVVGHDRGARVARRLALDHPEAVSRLAVRRMSAAAKFTTWRSMRRLKRANCPRARGKGRPRIGPSGPGSMHAPT